MTDTELVLTVLAGQTPGYRIDPAASAFAAVGLTDPDTVATLLASLQTAGNAESNGDGWQITDAGAAAAPTDVAGLPAPLPDPTPQQQVLAAIDALDPATATVADVIAAVHAALASS